MELQLWSLHRVSRYITLLLSDLCCALLELANAQLNVPLISPPPPSRIRSLDLSPLKLCPEKPSCLHIKILVNLCCFVAYMHHVGVDDHIYMKLNCDSVRASLRNPPPHNLLGALTKCFTFLPLLYFRDLKEHEVSRPQRFCAMEVWRNTRQRWISTRLASLCTRC